LIKLIIVLKISVLQKHWEISCKPLNKSIKKKENTELII
jgi:hypothetical protein